jgi:signal transduction histidine kinase
VRLIAGGRVVRAIDAPAGLAVPDGTGFRTLSADGSRYRSLTREAAPGVLVETGVDLGDSDARVAELRTRLLLVGLAGVMLVAVLSWWLAGLALAPLGRLRDQAGEVGSTEDLSRRISPGAGPIEIDELTAGINAMLARLEQSARETRQALEATRRFAGDAGHELRTPMTSIRANLGAIRRNPQLDPAELEAALDQMDRESGRMMRLLATLQTLARGDSSASIPSGSVDLPGLLDSAVEDARRRHPDVEWRLDLPEAELTIDGWSDGLRALVDNLLENAAAHGRSAGTVSVALGGDHQRLSLTVDDDGPGVPPDRRQAVFERFERGDATTADGSGLGLALVRQQARVHGGDVVIGESTLGGARFEVSLDPGAGPNKVGQ